MLTIVIVSLMVSGHNAPHQTVQALLLLLRYGSLGIGQDMNSKPAQDAMDRSSGEFGCGICRVSGVGVLLRPVVGVWHHLT